MKITLEDGPMAGTEAEFAKVHDYVEFAVDDKVELAHYRLDARTAPDGAETFRAVFVGWRIPR